MSWFWKSKAQLQAEKAALTAIQEVERLQAQIAESTRLQAEWQASAEEASHERDAIRAEAQQSIASERRQNADAVSEWNQKHGELQSSFRDEQLRAAQLDEAVLKLTSALQERERQIKEIQETGAHALSERDRAIEQRDRKIREMEAEQASTSTRLENEMAELQQQLEFSRQQYSALNEQFDTQNRQLTALSESTSRRIGDLEKQLAVSEARSTNRAGQRSELLRNLIEIHRLSEVASKSDNSSESLKLLQPEWGEQPWNEQNESESA